ncbi:Conserved_hypothetical protein [Hexamita inflata]|uniref:Uncharacterized protein n=1 Tax=Hexamita inflata TaxID=28002 RepID=A0AA86RQR7_9EUKA|nr:Conserved hypothetical protein [Hexamita inflata]CAI9977913.1 Conserved hypothetical protein [Hexamita inflata]
MNNLTSDSIEPLKNCKLPLDSFSFIGFFGAPGCGKTTQLQNVADTIVQWSKSTTYDLDKPTLCNGLVTHYIFMSPSTATDNTLAHKDQKILIEATDDNVLSIIDSITQMNFRFYETLNAQKFLRQISKDIYQEKYEGHKGTLNQLNIKQVLQNHPQYKLILLCLDQLEQFKQEYPELKFKETDQQVLTVLRDITSNKVSSFGSRFTYGLQQANPIQQSIVKEFDGYMIRRPKILLIIDDQTGSKLFRDVGNTLYQSLAKRRHLSLFYTGVSIHSPGALQIGYKTIMNSFLLFRGIPIEKLKDIYGAIQALDSVDFDVKSFIELYNQHTGYYETDMNKKDAYRFNFLYVQSQPMTSIWFKFDKRLK